MNTSVTNSTSNTSVYSTSTNWISTDAVDGSGLNIRRQNIQFDASVCEVKTLTSTITFNEIGKALVSSGILVVGSPDQYDPRLDKVAKKHAEALEALQKAVPEFAAVVDAAKEYRDLEKKIYEQNQIIEELKRDYVKHSD